MKNLVLIRHAEAESDTNRFTDFDRPLTASGKHDAAQMAAFLLTKGSIPQIIVSSPALRALTTAQIFTATLGLDDEKPNIKVYEAEIPALLLIINQLDDQNDVAGLVGHNPGISDILYFLTGKILTMATSSWAEIELRADNWAGVTGNSGKSIQYKRP